MSGYAAADLEQFATTLLAACGAPEETARTVAQSLVGADLRGHHSHGILRVPHYAQKIRDDEVDPTAYPEVIERSGTTASVDGNHALGQLTGHLAVEELTDIADEHGVGVVGIRHGTHLGRVGEWAERTVDEGYVFLAFTNSGGGSFTVAPAASATRRLSTNPITFAVPVFDSLPFDIVLDMATSTVAHGKIRERYASGEPIPDGWTTDEDGYPFKNPHRFGDGEGAIMPLGGDVSGYKGFGLSVVTELLAGIVGDGVVAGETEPGYSNNCAAFVAIDPLRFTDREGVARRVGSLAEHLRAADYEGGPSLGPGAKGEAGMLPGEPEHAALQKYAKSGIPLDDRIVDDLAALAAEVDVEVTI